MNFKAIVNQLAGLIENTSEFNQLKSLHHQIKQNAQLKSLLDQFEAKQNQAHASQSDKNKMQQMMNELNNDFQHLMTYPQIKQYFALHEKIDQIVGQLITDLNNEIAKRL